MSRKTVWLCEGMLLSLLLNWKCWIGVQQELLSGSFLVTRMVKWILLWVDSFAFCVPGLEELIV